MILTHVSKWNGELEPAVVQRARPPGDDGRCAWVPRILVGVPWNPVPAGIVLAVTGDDNEHTVTVMWEGDPRPQRRVR